MKRDRAWVLLPSGALTVDARTDGRKPTGDVQGQAAKLALIVAYGTAARKRTTSCRRTGCPTPARGMVEPALPAIVQRSFVCRTRPGQRSRSPVIFEIAVITTSNGSLLSSFPGVCILIFEIVVSISRGPVGRRILSGSDTYRFRKLALGSDKTIPSSMAGPNRIGLARRIVWISSAPRVHRFPGLRASDKNIGFRTEPKGIVERADAQPDHIGPGRDLDIERGPAVTTKCPCDFVAAIRLRNEEFRRALGEVKPSGRHPNRRHRRGTTLALAIAAMAAQCKHDVAFALVPDRAAQTAASSWCGHVTNSLVSGDCGRIRPM